MMARIALKPLFRVLSRARNTQSWTELKRPLRSQLLPAQGAKTAAKGQFPPALFQMASSYWISQAVYVAAKLGIADLLKDRSLKCSEIAAIVGADVRSTFRLMRSLSSLGIFALTKNGYFTLLPLGENLRQTFPDLWRRS